MARISIDTMKFTFVSRRDVLWHVECWKGSTGIYYGYMWHRKPLERITGGWREARTDAYAKITKEAAMIAKKKHGITLEIG